MNILNSIRGELLLLLFKNCGNYKLKIVYLKIKFKYINFKLNLFLHKLILEKNSAVFLKSNLSICI